MVVISFENSSGPNNGLDVNNQVGLAIFDLNQAETTEHMRQILIP